MSKWTPGPWSTIVHEAIDGGDYIQILAGSWDIAHNRHSARDWQEELANARLIAAVPDLLEACKLVQDWAAKAAKDEGAYDSSILDLLAFRLEPAIAKAEGDESCSITS